MVDLDPEPAAIRENAGCFAGRNGGNYQRKVLNVSTYKMFSIKYVLKKQNNKML